MEKNDINQEILNEMFLEIRLIEGENLKTGKYDDKTMVKLICNIIQKHAKEE